MAISFPSVPNVAVGDLVTSTQLNRLARALNERILSGVGDPTWRWAFWVHNFTSQIQAVSESLAQPHIDEYLKLFVHVGLYQDTTVIPENVGQGGSVANPTNPLVALALGSPNFDLDPEHDRLNQLALLDINLPFDALTAWDAAKHQRGAIDPDTGQADVPALDLAVQYMVIQYRPVAFYNRTYGGYLPTPTQTGDCGDGTTQVGPTPVFERIFTSRTDGSVKTYQCCCSADAPDGAGKVEGVGSSPGFFIIFHQSGLIERLPKDVWFEGPYSQGRLRRDEGLQLEAVLHEYAKSMRGSDLQRDPQPNVTTIGFDWQMFLERQYPLAPARGTYIPGTTPRVDAIYPQWQLPGPAGGGVIPAGTVIGAGHTLHAAMVVGGWAGWQANLKASVTVQILRDEEVFDEITLRPLTGTDNGSSLRYLPAPVPLPPISGGVITLRLLTDADFNDAGLLTFELLETIPLRPTLPDAYLVARCFGSVNEAAGDGDEHGHSFEQAKLASEKWFELGALGGKGLTEIEDLSRSVLHESARRVINSGYRLLDWRNLCTYHVNASGQSVLEFRRRVTIGGAAPGEYFDKFEGIGPAIEAVAKVRPGIIYRVDGGTVTYAGTLVASGAFFLGVYGVETWTVESGTPTVWEHNILRDAPVLGSETNRWVMHLHSTVFRHDAESFWNPEIYDDTIRLSNRCHTYSEMVLADADSRRHFYYNNTGVAGAALYSESVPGHTYAQGHVPQGSDEEVKGKYYCSCPIYPAPYDILAAEAVNVGGEDRIRLICRGRLGHDATHWFPPNPDPGTWSEAGVRAFDRRTDENAVITYLWSLASGIDLKTIVGDYALNRGNNIYDLTDDPWGAYLPRFHMMKLVPEVSEDENVTVEESDIVVDADQFTRIATYLRAICEGWVDRTGSAAVACNDESHIVDFSFQNLMLQASGGQYVDFPLMPLSVRGDSYSVRGAGPLSNTTLYAAHYNVLANAVNSLVRARLEIPVQSRFRILRYEDRQPITPSGSSGGGCDNYGGRWFDGVEIPPASTLISTDEWSDWAEGLAAAGLGASADAFVVADGSDGCVLVTRRDDIELEVRVPPGVDCALSPALGGSLGSVELYGLRSTQASEAAVRIVVPQSESLVCDVAALGVNKPYHDDAGNYFDWTQEFPPAETNCVAIPGTDTPPPLVASSDLYQAKHPPGAAAPEGFCSNAVSSQTVFEPMAASVPVLVFALTAPPP